MASTPPLDGLVQAEQLRLHPNMLGSEAAAGGPHGVVFGLLVALYIAGTAAATRRYR